MSLADLIARGGAVPGELNLADAAFSGIQAGQQAQARRLQAEGMVQENQARGLANLAASQQQGDLAAMRQAQNRAISVGPDGVSLNQASYLADLVQGGRGGIALAEQARLQAQQAAAREAQIAQAKAQHKLIADVLYGVKGPMDFAAALPALEKMGVNVSDLRAAPFRNDWRDVLQAQINMGLDVENKLKIEEMNARAAKEAAAQRALAFEQGLQTQQFGLAQQQAVETARRNRAGEAIDWYRAKNPPATVAAGMPTKPPTGYRYTADGNLEAIPGGPADAKQIEKEAKAQADAQKTTGFAEQGIGVIDKLLSAPGLKYITGLSSKAPIVPGTIQAQADALAKQLEGQAFLQAFQSLKGGGAITEKEGEKATAAMARLQRGQSQKDYSEALRELRGILQTAKDRAQGVSPAATGPKIGDEKTVNGVTGVWDGKTWRRK